MLTIRKKQNDVLAAYMEARYVEAVVAHVKMFWPEECQLLEEEGIHPVIRDRIERARSFGFETEYDISRYVDLTFALGKDFPSDSRIPWAAQILNDKQLLPEEKMDKLYQLADES